MAVKDYLIKYKSIITYIFFGALTTAINVSSYYLLYNVINLPNTLSVIIAWVLSVAFAFVTNKLFVFESKSWQMRIAAKEAFDFFICRIATGALEVALMFLLVDVFKFDGMVMKLITNVIVIILNYIASKLVIFKK